MSLSLSPSVSESSVTISPVASHHWMRVPSVPVHVVISIVHNILTLCFELGPLHDSWSIKIKHIAFCKTNKNVKFTNIKNFLSQNWSQKKNSQGKCVRNQLSSVNIIYRPLIDTRTYINYCPPWSISPGIPTLFKTKPCPYYKIVYHY